MNLEVRIGRLVLDGVELRQRERAALPDAVRSELLNLFAHSSSGPAEPPISGPGPDPHARSPRVDAIAHQIAASIHRELPAATRGAPASARRTGPPAARGGTR